MIRLFVYNTQQEGRRIL